MDNCKACCINPCLTISEIRGHDISSTPVLAFIITTQWVKGESGCPMNTMLLTDLIPSNPPVSLWNIQ